jgi:CDP-diacylglycerol--glycerol-3-phosphate 3-phosphatidyltransferase
MAECGAFSSQAEARKAPAPPAHRKRLILTVPNLITAARLALLPFILWLTCSRSGLAIASAATLFAVAAASDWADGYLARRLREATRFGTLLDPIVDKIMFLSTLFVFSARGLVPLWIAALNLLRESVITGLRHRLSWGRAAVGANWMGKLKFVLQVGLAELVYLHLLLQSLGSGLPGGTRTLFWCALAVTVLSYAFLVSFARRPRGGPATAMGGAEPQ